MNEQADLKGVNADLTTALYRLAVVLLLAGILAFQWQILGKMDASSSGAMAAGPTLGDLRSAADQQERQAIFDKMPIIRIQGGFVTTAVDSAGRGR